MLFGGRPPGSSSGLRRSELLQLFRVSGYTSVLQTSSSVQNCYISRSNDGDRSISGFMKSTADQCEAETYRVSITVLVATLLYRAASYEFSP